MEIILQNISQYTLKDWLGVWGALLSTFTVLGLWMTSVPILLPFAGAVGWDSKGNSNLSIFYRVINTSKRAPIQITKYNIIGRYKHEVGIIRKINTDPTNGVRATFLEQSELSKRRSGACKDFLVFVAAQKEVTITVVGISKETRCLVVLWWHRHGIVPCLPMLLWVNSRKAGEIHKGSPDYMNVTDV